MFSRAFKAIIVFAILICFAPSVRAVDTKNRVEELFIWKVSDELKLSVPEEKSFSKVIKTLNERRAQVNDSLQDVLRQLADSKTSKEKEKLLSEQKRLLRSYGELSLEEAEKIQKLLGIERAAQYFVLKNDLTHRLKTALMAPSDKASVGPTPVGHVKLGPPQVIEEK